MSIVGADPALSVSTAHGGADALATVKETGARRCLEPTHARDVRAGR